MWQVIPDIRWGKYAIGLFLDFSKAFDTDNHNIMTSTYIHMYLCMYVCMYVYVYVYVYVYIW